MVSALLLGCAPAADTCGDGVRNGGETDVDCGGPACGRCGLGKACAAALDCLSEVCEGGKCAGSGPACTDGVKGGDETDVDCGGGCPAACGDGKGCRVAADCRSLVCIAGACAAPACTDMVKNGVETDVDCGGTCPTKCPDHGYCRQHRDCASTVCTGEVCQVPTCADSVKNGVETDVDCGGGTCDKCGAGKSCKDAADCANGMCTANVCQ